MYGKWVKIDKIEIEKFIKELRYNWNWKIDERVDLEVYKLILILIFNSLDFN